jgi:hypothetical protein
VRVERFLGTVDRPVKDRVDDGCEASAVRSERHRMAISSPELSVGRVRYESRSSGCSVAL